MTYRIILNGVLLNGVVVLSQKQFFVFLRLLHLVKFNDRHGFALGGDGRLIEGCRGDATAS